jgi:hypothetical protein
MDKLTLSVLSYHKFSVICHGDRLGSARFGFAGGLSQPRRDTADPKESEIQKVRNEKPSLLLLSVSRGAQKLLNPVFSLSTVFDSTPCGKATSIAVSYSIRPG